MTLKVEVEDVEALAVEAARSAVLYMGVGFGSATGAWVGPEQYSDVLQMIRVQLGLRAREGLERLMDTWGVTKLSEKNQYTETIVEALIYEWAIKDKDKGSSIFAMPVPDVVAIDTFRGANYGWVNKMFSHSRLDERLESIGIDEWGVAVEALDENRDRDVLFEKLGWLKF